MAVITRGVAERRPSRFRYWRQWLTAYLFLAPYMIFPLVFIAGAIALARRRIGPRLLAAIDIGAGAGILGFGAYLGFRTAQR